MLTLTEPAQIQLQEALAEGLFEAGRLRVLIDHRCHCGKAHFTMALDETEHPGDEVFEVAEIPFVVDAPAFAELPLVEIDFVQTVWTKGFTIRNRDHECRHTTVR